RPHPPRGGPADLRGAAHARPPGPGAGGPRPARRRGRPAECPDPARAPDRPARRGRPHEHPDRRAPRHQPPHRRGARVEGAEEAGRPLARRGRGTGPAERMTRVTAADRLNSKGWTTDAFLEATVKKRLILLAGLGIGFVLGSYSGRSSYEKLRAQVDQLWSDPRVQEQFQKAGDTVREKGPEVAQAVRDRAPEVAAGVQTAAASAVTAGREKFDDLTHSDDDPFAGQPENAASVAAAAGAADADGLDEAGLDEDAPEDEALSTDGADPDIVSDPSTDPEAEGPVHDR